MRTGIRALIILLLSLPILTLFYITGTNYNDTNILEYIRYFNTTVIYVVTTTILSVLIGSFSAYVISTYDFHYRNLYQKLYILPLLFPSYMMALIYGEISSSFMSLWGLVFITTLVSIPYVYLIMYSHISSISRDYMNTANTFNIGKVKSFFNIMLPLMLPGVLLSSMVVMSDVLSEFGASYFYGVDTIMVVIYEEWFGIYNTGSATLISSITMIVIFFIFYFKHSFSKKVANPLTTKDNTLIKLNSDTSAIVSFILLIPVIFSLVIPMLVINEWFVLSYSKIDTADLLQVSINTVSFALVVVGFLTVISIATIYLFKNNKIIRTLLSMNYAIPGLFLSIILLSVFTHMSFYMSVSVLLLAFVIKYNMLMISSIEGYTNRIDRRLYYSTKSVGKSSLWYINNIQVPLSRNGIILGSILVFIDVLRELPMMLTLRPYNFDTISTKIFSYYHSEWVQYTAPYFVIMMVLSLPFVLYLVRQLNDKS